jgi:hypothetical protein
MYEKEFESLKNGISELNTKKNQYAQRKKENDVCENEKKELISDIASLIDQIRYLYNNANILEVPEKDRQIFVGLNNDVKLLKTHILCLIENRNINDSNNFNDDEKNNK